MVAKVLCTLLALSAIAWPSATRAADALPILSGRWSTGVCAGSTPNRTRWFAPNVAASLNDRCRLTAEWDEGGLYRAHLACRYSVARRDTDDVVLEVMSATSLRWVDQCSATLYRFCERGEPPALPGPTPRR